MKKWFIIAIVLLAAVAVFLMVGISNLGPIIKKAVNTYGPDMTKTAVHLGDADVSVLSGRVSLKAFSVGNPKGFSASEAIRVGSILLDVDEKSLTGDTIVIDHVAVIGPEISYEKMRGTDNFQTILNNVKQATGQGGATKETSAQGKTSGAGKHLLIKDFVLEKGKVTLTESMLSGEQVTVALPDIHLTDVGGKGKPAAKAIEEILSVIYAKILSPAVKDALNRELKKLGTKVEEKGQEAVKKLEDKMDERSKKELEKAKEQLKGLLNK